MIFLVFTEKLKHFFHHTGRDYYDESLTMHESELSNLERRAQLESNDVQDHTNDINDPEHESHYHNNLQDSFYFNPRERSSSCASQSRSFNILIYIYAKQSEG